jgi:hypothetical protein
VGTNHFRRAWLTVIPLLVVAMLWLAGCDDDVSGPTEVAEEPFAFDLDAVDQLRLILENINGTITVSGALGTDSAFIDGVRQVWSESREDAEAHLSDVHVEVDVVADSIIVRTTQPTRADNRIYAVNYELVIPARLEVWIVNANGVISVEFIDNTVSIVNANGDITLDEIVGSVAVVLANGDVDSQVTLPLDGVIDHVVANGSIQLSIPTNTSAVFSAEVGNGTISTSNLVFENQTSTDSTFTGRLGEGRGEIALVLGNGNITVLGF